MQRKRSALLDVSDFSFDPLDQRFVPPKPQHNIEDHKVLVLEEDGNLIITRKRDGYCHIIVVCPAGVKIYTRTGNDVTHLYQEIVADLQQLNIPPGTIILAELIVDEAGKDAFPKVGKLAKTEKDRVRILAEAGAQASIMPFNLMVHGGQWLQDHPNEERFARLQRMFEDCSDSSIKPFEILQVTYKTAIDRMRKSGWEGLVLYHRLEPTGFLMNGNFRQPIRPAGSWKKKDRLEDDFVVIEKVPSIAKSWPGALKEFIIVQFDPKTGQPVECGRIGNGLSREERYDFMDNEKYPLPLVIQVRFTHRFIEQETAKLRSGDFVTIRYDKSPEECLFNRENYKHTRSNSKKNKAK